MRSSGGAVLDRLKLVAKFQRAGGLRVSFERGFVAPIFHDDEAVRTPDLGKRIDAQIAVFLGACVAILLEQSDVPGAAALGMTST